MKLKDIRDSLRLARAYKYTCELALEKDKRRNCVFHDCSDLNEHHIKQIEIYDKHIKRLHKHRLDFIARTFNAILSSVFLVLCLTLFHYWGIF